jgi:putative DNA methylase
MTKAKKLIEVAMPVKEISAESVRDKSIRHGHISTLHLWWARRPLPVCRAVVFASLVPDPLDENCPQAFRDAVELLLGSAKNPLSEQGFAPDPYKPYDDIPYTAAIDKMEDNARNRLLMFIGKYSDEFSRNEKAGKTTASGKQLSDASLIKWDNKNDENIIGKARKLIWVAHNCTTKGNTLSANELLSEFDKHFAGIKSAEETLYSIKDRHIATKEVEAAEQQLKNSIEAFLDKMPKVFDPFAGGGAIPLEAARLGCRSFGNDINPVAHIIQKGSLEFPQKFGKPITYSKAEFLKIYDLEEWKKLTNENLVFQNGEPIAVNIANRLSFDVAFYARKLLAETEKEIGHYYPADSKGNKPIAYYWARVGTCSNPSCRAEIPLIKSFYLANTKSKLVHLRPVIKGKDISFEIKNGKSPNETWLYRGNLQCPVCGNTTDVNTLKQQFVSKKTSERLIAVIEEGKNSKEYRLPTSQEIGVLANVPSNIERPTEPMPVKYTQALPACTWGFVKWSDLQTNRQIVFLLNLVDAFNKTLSILPFQKEYSDALKCLLAIFVDRIAVANTSFGVWHTGGEKLERIMGRQAISMVFDYPESNPFCSSSGSALNQLDWLTRYIESEGVQPFSTELKNASSGEKSQFAEKYISAVVTDPPYYDAIAYADLSDFFYIWLKRTLGDVYPLNFATPQTPKTEECTALKHHHDGNSMSAKEHFENKLLQIFDAIEHQTSDLVSIMFAHQSTEAWTTLCNSILGARMNITGSWATDTEMTGALKTDKSFLSSSVTVCAKPSQRIGLGDFKEVKKAIERTVSKEVEELYQLGFRGADLLTACFGQAVSEFGKYEKVEKADGSEVTVAELLEMARESAFNALLKGFDGDDFTKFYIGWLQLYSFAESEFDDAAKFSRVGLSINVAELFTEHILIKNGNKQTLGTFEERIKANKNIGDRTNNFLIDLVHRAMALYKGNNRTALLQYISKVAAQPESNFWRVVTSLCEVLPSGSEDHKQALGLLTNKDSLIRESKTVRTTIGTQTYLFES